MVILLISGAGTNVIQIVVRIPSAPSAGKNFVVPLHIFGYKSSTCRFGERFRDGQYSLVSLLLAVLQCAPSPAICKSGVGHVPPYPMESAPVTVYRH